jgi:hypothetical protein
MKWLTRLAALSQNSERPRDPTDKTDTSPSVSSVSAQLGPSQDSDTPSVSSVSSGRGTYPNPDYDPFGDPPANDSACRGEWQRWFNLLVTHKLAIDNLPTQLVDGTFMPSHRTHEEAHALAYGEAQCLWHERYG